MRRKIPHTYFVGRRPCEAPELYAVTATDVERLEALDWRGGDAGALRISHLLLERVVEPEPSGDLAALFTLAVLPALPADGFVLDSDAIRDWVKLAARSASRASNERPRRRPWFARVRS
jgi:hypothetical protein